MREGNKRLLAIFLFASAALTLSVASYCQVPAPIWPTYHNDMIRGGQNENSTDIKNPASNNVIWAFPRNANQSSTATEYISDNRGSDFTGNSAWSLPLLSDECYDSTDAARTDDFVAIVASSRQNVDKDGLPLYTVNKVSWVPPSTLGTGRCQIMVWVPAIYYNDVNNDRSVRHVNTTMAEYTVYDDSGATAITFDQTHGGEWKLLSTRQFSNPTRVELSNVTNDDPKLVADEWQTDPQTGVTTAKTNPHYITVVADALKFVPTIGGEIYASVASAQVPWHATWDGYTDNITPYGATPTMSTLPAGSFPSSGAGLIPAVYACTVESPLGNASDSPDSGAVYCINSITPTAMAYNAGSGTGTLTSTDNYSLSKFLGRDIWRYPRPPAQRMTTTYSSKHFYKDASDNEVYEDLVDPAFAVGPNPIEGPIEGGIYASPTLALVDDGSGKLILVCYVAGMDKQVYAINATTGELLWKGPGITVGEGATVGSLNANAQLVQPAEAFGGSYSYIPCSGISTLEAASWTFTEDSRKNLGGEPSDGLAYSIYAWIPTRSAGEVGIRAADATYTITFNNGSTPTATTSVKVDQSLPSNQGKWVKLGSSYFNVSNVSLSAYTEPPDTTSSPTSYCVIADAVMIVPDTVDAFNYCTPVVDLEGPQVVTGSLLQPAMRVFAVTGSGRAISFKSTSFNAQRIARVEWIYPKVRTSAKVTGEADLDDPSLGTMTASPAFLGDKLYVAGMSGKLHRLDGVRLATFSNPPTEGWVFPDKNDVEDPVGFTSSPAIDKINNQLFIGATDGAFYCLDIGTGNMKWTYPESTTGLPLGAFRFSTPAIATDKGGMRRVWVGSSDGRVYSFDAGSIASDRRLYVEFDGDGVETATHGKWYLEPSALSPVQASVAIDGATADTTGDHVMYVGDMRDRGVLHWYDINTGKSKWSYTASYSGATSQSYTGWTCEGPLFSSPNITNIDAGGTPVSYVYCGCGDGRVYALSRDGGAWGGRWAGGDWQWSGDPDHHEQAEIYTGPDTEIQFDIFGPDFYKACDANQSIVNQTETDTNVSPSVQRDIMPTTWPSSPADPAWIISKKMKQPTTSLAGQTKEQIDEKLTEYAREMRKGNLFPSDSARSSGSSIYFEWGEKIYMVLWNLPAEAYLYGTNNSGKKANIRFNFVNTSAGASAGSQIRLTGATKVLKEYNVLDLTTATGNNGTDDFTYYNQLTYPLVGAQTVPDPVRRCYAIAQIEIKSTGSNPPSPGPGWVLSCEIRRKVDSSASSPFTQLTIPLAKLSAGKLEPVYRTNAAKTETYDAVEQNLGINNPLAISTGTGEMAWSATFKANRADPEAHYNGNGYYDEATSQFSIRDPFTLGLGPVAHGTNSPVNTLGVMDRSATGLTVYPGSNPVRQQMIERFRVSPGDLRWSGGETALTSSGGVKFPWEMGIGSSDYPNIFKRYQLYRKHSDDLDPSRQASTLPPLYLLDPLNPPRYDDTTLRPDSVDVSVEVPRFQPANNTGYTRTLEAYVDSNGGGYFDSGNVVSGRPSTFQEAYRKFKVALTVPPDPRMEVEDQRIDIGQVPHGLGEALGPVMGLDFMAENPTREIQQYFKRVTIKNTGNTNLYRVAIGTNMPLFLQSSTNSIWQYGPASPLIPGTQIRSTLDNYTPFNPWLTQVEKEPFITSPTAAAGDFGYTLTKSRVGDPDPSILTVPDKRKWDADYRFSPDTYTQSAARNAYQIALANAGLDPTTVNKFLPLPVEVSVAVPVSQPVGTYQAPFVPVTALYGAAGAGYSTFAAPTFALGITVRESQITGDRLDACVPQIEDGQLPGTPLPRFGDATPAAYRDAATGDVHMFWSSNRLFDSKYRPDPLTTPPDSPKWGEFASAPWFLDRGTLDWNMDTHMWAPTGSKWWSIPGKDEKPYLPAFQWPDLMGQEARNASVAPWKYDSENTTFLSVKHHSPFIGENLDVPAGAASGRTWLAWAGTADVALPDGKIGAEHRVFYTDATGGNVTDESRSVLSIPHEPAMDKRYPCLSVFNKSADAARMWMFWQGGESGKWSIYYSTNDDAGFPSNTWKTDQKLRTPDCLASVSSPNAVRRVFWADLRGSEPSDTGAKPFFDVVYAGTTKLQQNSDILLGRYAAVASNDPVRSAQPGNQAQPLPRVFGEKLARDAKFGFFTSEHLAWLKIDPVRIANGTPLPDLDNWGGYDMADINADMPYIRVYFPTGYTAPDPVDPSNTISLAEGACVSGTDGRVLNKDGSAIYDPRDNNKHLTLDTNATDADFRLQIDQATGIYTYKYPKDSPTRKLLGDMIVDFSAGTVRFTNPLRETKNDDGTVSTPEVKADYTPQTWRLTTDASVDNSPRAFIERTPLNALANPAMSPDDFALKSVDRLWALWRKAGTGIEGSTIYWKTYRVGVDLAKLGMPPIPMKRDHSGQWVPADDIEVENNLGPWEVDRTGTRIYFSQVDERYRSLIKSGNTAFLTTPPPPATVVTGAGLPVPINISYKDATGNDRTAHCYDVFWQNELPEQSLFGFAGSASVNEGSVYAFADPGNPGTIGAVPYSKIWVFWTTTRSGTSDLCWANLSPDFSAR